MNKPRKITRRRFLLASALTAAGALAAAGGVGWSLLSREHEEARSLPRDAADVDRLNDGS